MPIDRDGKHWCAPDNETPDAGGLWSCSCGLVWHFDPAWRVWEPVPPAPEDTGGAE